MLNDRELATVLAALRYWQGQYPLDPNDAETPLGDIATSGATLEAMSDEEIDVLCERLNTSSAIRKPTIAVVVEGGMVTAIISDEPTQIGRVVVIDYDRDGVEDDELCPIRQDDGREELAIVRSEGVITPDIDLAGAVRWLDSEGK